MRITEQKQILCNFNDRAIWGGVAVHKKQHYFWNIVATSSTGIPAKWLMDLCFYSTSTVCWHLKVLYNTSQSHTFIHLMADDAMQGADMLLRRGLVFSIFLKDTWMCRGIEPATTWLDWMKSAVYQNFLTIDKSLWCYSLFFFFFKIKSPTQFRLNWRCSSIFDNL